MVVTSASKTNTILTSIADWSTATSYVIGQYVQNGAILYKCILNHTSGVFATDLPTKWLEINDSGYAVAMVIALS